MSTKAIKGNPPNHVEWKEQWRVGEGGWIPMNGEGNRGLVEPFPQYYFREGDNHIEGENNTLIVLGRDRQAESGDEVFTNNTLKKSDKSGYSNYMGAGAIDIVVGRGAPFPLEETQVNSPFVLGPLFNTIRPATLEGYPLEGGALHPGVAMDAARIYISQMTDIDENFKIRKPLPYVHADDADDREYAFLETVGRTPSSGIMLKADKVRMHARQNIKLVTRGPEETVNSMGNPIKGSMQGIHLVANNGFNLDGTESYQHPMVLGSNLEAALHNLCDLIEESVRITSNFLEVQDRFNMKVANHFHFSPPGMSLVDIQSSIQGIITGLELLTKGKLQATFHDINIVNFKTRFLTNANSEDHILSKYNTVN